MNEVGPENEWGHIPAGVRTDLSLFSLSLARRDCRKPSARNFSVVSLAPSCGVSGLPRALGWKEFGS